MQIKKNIFFITLLAIIAVSCKKNDGSSNTEPARVVFKFKFDSTQVRLNNIGLPVGVGAGRAALSPRFNVMSAHYIEFAQNAFTPLGSGFVLYRAPEVTTGGSNAIDFSRAIKKGANEDFFALALKDIPNGSYEYIRLSLAYQNYDIDFKFGAAMQTGTVASFIGFNTYISSFPIKTITQNVNANKLQGFWAFESLGTSISGQAPPGATTVPNPIFTTSPIPQGSCVVTAAFVDAAGNPKPLVITGGIVKDINVLLSLSTNKSFEWIEVTNDGIFEPSIGETVVDMGLRGLKPIVQ